MDDSGITCDEVIESNNKEIKTILTNFNEKHACKTQGFYILLVFLLITITLSTAVSIHCCLIKYRAKQKNLLAFHEKNIKTILSWC